jgi:hypothetical protein
MLDAADVVEPVASTNLQATGAVTARAAEDAEVASSASATAAAASTPARASSTQVTPEERVTSGLAVMTQMVTAAEQEASSGSVEELEVNRMTTSRAHATDGARCMYVSLTDKRRFMGFRRRRARYHMRQEGLSKTRHGKMSCNVLEGQNHTAYGLPG